MANNNDGQIVLGLDIPKTVSQINADIKKLQSQLDQVKTIGTLDTNATVQEINAKIKALQSQLKTIEIQATVSPANLQKQATQTGQQIGKLISDSAEKAISNVSSKSIGKYFRVSKSDSSAFEHEMEKLAWEMSHSSIQSLAFAILDYEKAVEQKLDCIIDSLSNVIKEVRAA